MENSTKIDSTTSPYTAKDKNNIIECDTSKGDITINLPYIPIILKPKYSWIERFLPFFFKKTSKTVPEIKTIKLEKKGETAHFPKS